MSIHPIFLWATTAAAAAGALRALSYAGVLSGLPVEDILAADLMLVSAFILGRLLMMGPLRIRGGGVVVETVTAAGLGLGTLSTIFFLLPSWAWQTGPPPGLFCWRP